MKIPFKTLGTCGYLIGGVLSIMFVYSLYRHPPKDTIIEKSAVVIQEHQSTTFEATGYSVGYPYAAATKSGMPLVNKGFFNMGNLAVFTIAVDPNIIPLGSVVFIQGMGIGYATDTGTAIKGMKIDIAFGSMKEAIDFGKKSITVEVLRKGW